MKNNLYKEGIKQQKSFGWFFVITGIIFTLTIFGALFGIPMIIIGIAIIKNKDVNAITATMIKNKIRK